MSEDSHPIQLSLTLDAFKRNIVYKHPSMPKSTPVYIHGDVIKGKFSLKLKDSTTIQHKGLSLSIVGRYQGPAAPSVEPFFVKTLQLLPPSKLSQSIQTIFNFDRIALPTGSYYGNNFSLVYFVELKIDRGFQTLVRKKAFYYVRPQNIVKTPLSKGIGITNVLHMDIIFDSTTVDPRVGFVGALYFRLFKLRIVSVSFEIIRREGDQYGIKQDTSLICFEVLDGAPVKGTLVPIRFFTGALNLWPSPKNDKITVEHFLKVHAVDETGAVYIKLHPVNFVFQLHQ